MLRVQRFVTRHINKRHFNTIHGVFSANKLRTLPQSQNNKKRCTCLDRFVATEEHRDKKREDLSHQSITVGRQVGQHLQHSLVFIQRILNVPDALKLPDQKEQTKAPMIYTVVKTVSIICIRSHSNVTERNGGGGIRIALQRCSVQWH